MYDRIVSERQALDKFNKEWALSISSTKEEEKGVAAMAWKEAILSGLVQELVAIENKVMAESSAGVQPWRRLSLVQSGSRVLEQEEEEK
ncbi:hypothetical protein BGX23_008073 [Mortierella sp. AD031]|nr:hypothetical protein BGX23_008073 [Mortierella sp. AD031]KAG0208418.1 hypothetical protein BGX33_006246 [Mortierella sp. NVP41]